MYPIQRRLLLRRPTPHPEFPLQHRLEDDIAVIRFQPIAQQPARAVAIAITPFVNDLGRPRGPFALDDLLGRVHSVGASGTLGLSRAGFDCRFGMGLLPKRIASND
jgi:hypothetical protein